MLEIVYPKVNRDVITRDYGRFVIGPLEPGYGVTVGNALRRVLISSLQGAAITSVRIMGIHHEFSPIPGVKEDTVQLLLNLKQVRLLLHAEDEVRVRLEASGEGVVTAADIICPSEVEIINPEIPLLTLDSSDSEIELEMTVDHGRGYSPADDRGPLPIDEIPVDAIFSPIRKVRYSVEQTRVEQMTDFDRLTLEVWTDGTVSPDKAVTQAAEILVKHFQIVTSLGKVKEPSETAETLDQGSEQAIEPAVYNMPIEELGLTVRAFNCLKRAGITEVGEIIERLRRSRDEMLAIRNFGEKSLEELVEKLEEKGLYYLLEPVDDVVEDEDELLEEIEAV
ncbi:MAG: DNA-directed RNA polymerase subunit alpha [Chloroflexi bacterium]|nr:DNA-directed RNA polymerase subunit alpha [Chloroflexota bacterium]